MSFVAIGILIYGLGMVLVLYAGSIWNKRKWVHFIPYFIFLLTLVFHLREIDYYNAGGFFLIFTIIGALIHFALMKK